MEGDEVVFISTLHGGMTGSVRAVVGAAIRCKVSDSRGGEAKGTAPTLRSLSEALSAHLLLFLDRIRLVFNLLISPTSERTTGRRQWSALGLVALAWYIHILGRLRC